MKKVYGEGDHEKRGSALHQGERQDRCKVAIRTDNVEVDDGGYIYIADCANTGLHILELAGEARKIAGLAPSQLPAPRFGRRPLLD